MDGDRNCLRCGGKQEAGVLLDRISGAGNAMPETWQQGQPGYSIWTGVKREPDRQHDVVTYRCTSCGTLESVAI